MNVMVKDWVKEQLELEQDVKIVHVFCELQPISHILASCIIASFIVILPYL